MHDILLQFVISIPPFLDKCLVIGSSLTGWRGSYPRILIIVMMFPWFWCTTKMYYFHILAKAGKVIKITVKRTVLIDGGVPERGANYSKKGTSLLYFNRRARTLRGIDMTSSVWLMISAKYKNQDTGIWVTSLWFGKLLITRICKICQCNCQI